uniref:AlNc14C70G4827 protein n=1 Tax=Albugo laibachii Nc14 TaxID=890382 RepID=F0WDV8_9STRA|nr:AlNc14C70G4827 [Albugo laibachii Nc14]|eukprot:CCA19386.1 AlNc14C70G4827 [Albugo laibachii Nc14]
MSEHQVRSRDISPFRTEHGARDSNRAVVEATQWLQLQQKLAEQQIAILAAHEIAPIQDEKLQEVDGKLEYHEREVAQRPITESILHR